MKIKYERVHQTIQSNNKPFLSGFKDKEDTRQYPTQPKKPQQIEIKGKKPRTHATLFNRLPLYTRLFLFFFFFIFSTILKNDINVFIKSLMSAFFFFHINKKANFWDNLLKKNRYMTKIESSQLGYIKKFFLSNFIQHN